MPEPATDGPDGEVVLGVDYGTVRVGLALGFVRSGLVVPLPVAPHPGSDDEVARTLCAVAAQHGARRIVLGNPVHMTGEASPMSERVGRLAELVRGLAPELEVALEDERLSSAAAEAALRAAGLRWWEHGKAAVDAGAAMTIARDYLHRLDPSLAAGAEEPPPAPAEPTAERRQRRRRAQRRARRRGGEA